MLPILDSNGRPINTGRSINYINGIQGIGAGPGASNPLWNGTTDQRVHRLNFKCTAVNYTGGAGLATKHITGGGNDAAIVTLTVSASQVPVSVAITTAGNGYNVGDTFSVTDPTGTGGVFTVATLTGGAGTGIATATYVANSASASLIDPGVLLGIVKVNVNGIAMRDVSARFLLMICQANGLLPLLGELPIYFTEEWRKIIRTNDANSFDLYGQQTFSVQFAINAGYLLPGIAGTFEFDNLRNQVNTKNGPVVFLEPVAYHLFTFNLLAGATPITTLPTKYPIARIWVLGTNPGNITQLEVRQNGNPVHESFLQDMKQLYGADGFQFGQANYANQNQTAAKPLGFNPINYFDYAFIADNDQRYTKALKVKGEGNLNFKLWSNVAQGVNLLVESLPGAYAGY